MADRNDNGWLGLSLGSGSGSGSGCGATESPLFFNLMQRPSQPVIHNTTSWTRMFRLSDRREAETRSFHRGFIDVNRAPAPAADVEDENGMSSPNSTVSSLSGKRSEREVIAGEENEGERNSWSSRGGSDDEDGGNGDMSSRKKLRLTKEQSMQLEDKFNRQSSLNTREKQELAQQLNLRPRQVEVWFQNRRARTKLKQTEMDCDELRTCVDNLTKENARLRKEVEELRKLKLSPESSMHMSPPTTLTMCPQCQVMGVSSSSSSAAAATATTATVSATVPTSQQEKHTIHRPVPISPWAALLNPQYRPPATGL